MACVSLSSEPACERRRCLWQTGGALVSGVLLAASFPPLGIWQVAWVGLVPLLLTVMAPDGIQPVGWGRSAARGAFRPGFIAGLAFWLMTLSWLLCLRDTSPAPMGLIVLGWVGLAAYCALYWGGFTLVMAWLAWRVGVRHGWRTLLLMPVAAVVWIGFEYGRAVICGGFPWNQLGVSQFTVLPVIQSAEWFGVYGVSFLIVLLNAGVAFTVMRYLPGRFDGRYRPHVELFAGLLSVALVVRSGAPLVTARPPVGRRFEVAAVQPAIAQVKKWTDEHIDAIHTTLRRMTEAAVQGGVRPPDLVVWPETATPLCVTSEGASQDLVRDLSRFGVPLLVGSMDIAETNGDLRCYNASFLFDARGSLVGRYDKQHLVPFGEVVPFSEVIPWLARFAPMGWNCTPGHDAVILRVATPPVPFACLICFEDTMADLSRRAVRKGARLLINQTNDAWFDASGGPGQHMSHCVFRAVENRVPAVRVANSGITCLIQPNGRVITPTSNGRDCPPEPRLLRWAVAVPAAAQPLTLYARYGDWLLGIPAGVVTAACFVLALTAAARNSKRSLATARSS